MKKYGKLTAGIIVAWFIAAVIASAMHVFTNGSGRVGVAVGVAASAPILLFGAWYLTSSAFRDFTHSLNPRTLTILQSWRVLGLMFVVLQTYKILPAVFALPAGYGDMVIGATAVLVGTRLANPATRTQFMAWQWLGIADLLTAVGLGTTAAVIDPNGIPMAPLTMLPLSLIPTFLVPLFFVFHLICLAQAKQWKTTTSTRGPELGVPGPALAK